MSGKLKASGLVIFVFCLGILSGACWQSYRMVHHLPGHFAERRITRLSHQLHLSREQELALRDVFQTAHERAQQVNEEVAWDLDDIHEDSVGAINKILTPEQKKEFDRIHRRIHAHHHGIADDTAMQKETISTSTATPS